MSATTDPHAAAAAVAADAATAASRCGGVATSAPLCRARGSADPDAAQAARRPRPHFPMSTAAAAAWAALSPGCGRGSFRRPAARADGPKAESGLSPPVSLPNPQNLYWQRREEASGRAVAARAVWGRGRAISPPAGAEPQAGPPASWARAGFRGHWLLAGEPLTGTSGRPLRVTFESLRVDMMGIRASESLIKKTPSIMETSHTIIARLAIREGGAIRSYSL